MPKAQHLRTPLCDLLGIEFPILQAPMTGGPATPEMVAAVSGAGGLGQLGASRMSPQQLREGIRFIRSRTDRPFGVNLLAAPPIAGNPDVGAVQRILDRFRKNLRLPAGPAEVKLPPSPMPALLDVVFEEKVPILSFAMGEPGDVVDRAHEAGMRVLTMVTTVDEAVSAAQRGADVIIAQGAEAGGHRSTFKIGPGPLPLVGTMALVPQVVDAVKVPVVAAGGIADGRGLVAALALGADGVQLGTRFLVARESGAFSGWKERILAARESDTELTASFTGRPARSLRNRIIEEFEREKVEPLGWPLQAVAADDIYHAAATGNKPDYFPLLTGQSMRLLKRDQGSAEIVAELVREATAVLGRMPR